VVSRETRFGFLGGYYDLIHEALIGVSPLHRRGHRHDHRWSVRSRNGSALHQETSRRHWPNPLYRPGAAPTPNDEDWHANLLWCEERKCLPLTHAGTLFTIFKADVRVADLRTTDSFVSGLIWCELINEVLPLDLFGDMYPAELMVAKARGRSVLGCTNDMAFYCSTTSIMTEVSSTRTSWHSIGPWVAISTVPATTNDRST
jgi:hypothetical protein